MLLLPTLLTACLINQDLYDIAAAAEARREASHE